MENTYEMEATGQIRQPSTALPERLTPRQLDVLALLCQGLSNKQIGRQLNIASATVKIHVAHILRALNVSSRLQAVIAARSCGVAHPDARRRGKPSPRRVSDWCCACLLGDDDASRVLAAASDWSLAAAAG